MLEASDCSLKKGGWSRGKNLALTLVYHQLELSPSYYSRTKTQKKKLQHSALSL